MPEIMYTNSTPITPEIGISTITPEIGITTSLFPTKLTFNTSSVTSAVKIGTMPEVDRIIFNDPATIVFWKDGTKTVVKTSEDSEFSYYWGFCAAVAEKVFGSNHAVKGIIRRNCNLELNKQLELKDVAKTK